MIRFDCSEVMANVKVAQAELERESEKYEGIQRKQDFEAAANTDVAIAAAERNAAAARLSKAQAAIADCRITAPFAARVVKLSSFEGQTVIAGAPIVEIVAMATPRIRVTAKSAVLKWVKPGRQFTFTVDETGTTHQGRVIATNGAVDTASQTIDLEAIIQGPAKGLMPGMSATVTF